MNPRLARLLAFASMGLLAAVALSGARAEVVITGTAAVRDGDSLALDAREIRLYGIDAPEADQTCDIPPFRRPYACGLRATLHLRLLAESLEARCRVIDTDRFGRAVAQCEVAGRDLAEEMVRAGHAVVYARYAAIAARLIARYRLAEAEAKALRRGLWAGGFEWPERWRMLKQQAGRRP